MATIRDVAHLANVSVATVSNALNNPAKVSPELLARVRAAVDKLGYAPDAAARSLRKRSSGLLGLIVADITNPFFSELFEAIELAAAARGFTPVVPARRVETMPAPPPMDPPPRTTTEAPPPPLHAVEDARTG